MLGALTVLLVCQLAGEVIAHAVGLPVPGPVVGLVLLFIGLLVRGGVPDPLGRRECALTRAYRRLSVEVAGPERDRQPWRFVRGLSGSRGLRRGARSDPAA